MAIVSVHTFLVHPKKATNDHDEVTGTAVRPTGKLFDLLNGIYERSDAECDIDIMFAPASDGTQKNPCRDLFCAYLSKPGIVSARAIADRLEGSTDARSGLGLLFLIAGKEHNQHKLVISRFPTDNAIYVEENLKNLTVQFFERVFLKKKSSYKAVAYKGASLTGDFWKGKAIDRQLNSPAGHVSDYWIADFLLSELTTTPAAGTQRLAVALKNAAKKSPLKERQEIVAAAILAEGLRGQKISIESFMHRFQLSAAAREAIAREVKLPRLTQERFTFDLNEYRSLVGLKSVQLSNGATLSAPSADFDEVFQQEPIGRDGARIRFTTEGEIVDERFKQRA